MHQDHAGRQLPTSRRSIPLRHPGATPMRRAAVAGMVIAALALVLAVPASAAVAPGLAARAATARQAAGVSPGADPAWAIQPVPTATAAHGQVVAVSCTSATFCITVGFHSNSAGKLVTLAERWDGTSWSAQATPSPAMGSAFNGISCTSATACTAVGYSITSGGAQVALAERWNGTSWSAQASPSPAGAQGSVFNAVSCASATACTAAGNFGNSAGKQMTLAEGWDGTSWSVQATPNPAGAAESNLAGISCPSAAACTAVGDTTNSASKQVVLVERWNGTSWSIQGIPKPPTAGSALTSVSCPTATACTAAGQKINSVGTPLTLAERWNGTTWSIQATPNPAGFNSLFEAVSCPSATGCTATGISFQPAGTKVLAERWNGTAWSIQSAPTPPPGDETVLAGVSCTSATACTAVGSYRDTSALRVTLAERWNGTSWSIQATVNPTGARTSSLASVSCTSATACTAAGDSTNDAGPPLPLAERWNGSTWSVQAAPSPAGFNSFFEAVSCPSATVCTAVGNSFNVTGSQTLAERWNGTSWSVQATPNPAGVTTSALTSVSCTSGTACTAVGYSTGSDGTQVTLAERWNGSTWAVQATPNPAGAPSSTLNGVACTSATACTAVGNYTGSDGTQVTLAERWNGTSWSIRATPNPSGATESNLAGISCSSATACTAAGDYTGSDGTQVTLAERWNGTSWSIQPTPNPSGAQTTVLGGVSCPSAAACTAVGNFTSSDGRQLTLAEAWDGTAWSVQPTENTGTSPALNGVSCQSATACTAVGTYANTGTNMPLAERYS